MSASLLSEFDHPSWLAVVGTVAGYAAILLVMTIVLFLVPYLVFLAV